MKNVTHLVVTALLFVALVAGAQAQTGKPVTIVDANKVSATELAALPHMNAERAKAVIAKRPFKTIKDFDAALSALTPQQRGELYTRVFVPINLNTATDEEILLIPGMGKRMLHEFKEYRPYTSMAQFNREIGKYVNDTELARLAQYVMVPQK